MKIIVSAFLFLLSYTSCFGQADTTRIPFVSYWSTGDSYNFKVTEIHRQWKEEDLTEDDTSSYIANFLVLDSTATTYTIKWSYNTNFADLNISPKYFKQFAAYEKTEVIYKTSELGEFIGIENWKELAEMMNELFDKLAGIIADENNKSKEEVQKVIRPLSDVYNSQQGLEQLVFKSLQYFHFPFGVEYSVAEPIVYEELLPNMLGGDPIRGASKIYFDSVDTENGFCVLIKEMKLHPDDSKALVEAAFKRISVDDEEVNKAIENAQIDIRDYNRYDYYYYPGVPLKIETNREAIINVDKTNVKRIDITIIELMDQ